MNISYFTKILEVIGWTFVHFTPVFWIFCMAILCAIAHTIKTAVSLRR